MLTVNLATFSVLMSEKQQDSVLSLATWIILGAVTGLIVSKLLNKNGVRLVRYVLLGTVGAIVGGFLANLFGKSAATGLDLYSLLVAVVGAIVFVLVYHALFRPRRFLSMW